MMAFARALLTDAAGKEKVIALGDYNLREEEDAYQLVDAAFTSAWLHVYPTGISDTGLDMSGNKRIDHIFISPDLDVRNTDYILAPESHTDHPAHWAQVTWLE
jgi:endonuclease/exonuclease/phosphatase family metal-dependent hydrolase